jgi:hypothetical protein
MYSLERKIENGKLVRLYADFDGDIINEIKITGDFFIHPEDALLSIEHLFLNKKVSSLNHLKLGKHLRAHIVGFTLNDIISMLQEIYSKKGGVGNA